MTPTPLDAKQQGAQLKPCPFCGGNDHINSEGIDNCLATLRQERDTALRALAEARRDAERWREWTQTAVCGFMFGNTPNEQMDERIAARQPEKDANNG